MFYTEEHKTYSASRHPKCNLIHSCTLYCKLWYNFLVSSSHTNKVFILQKKIIRIINNTRPCDSCREGFKSMEIMTSYSQNIYSLVKYTINKKNLFDKNNEIHKYKTRNNNKLHLPIANISKFNKRAYISGIKVFNHVPHHIKALTNYHKYFKSTLKRYLYHHTFYSMNESSTCVGYIPPLML